jgi:hypothetical protein
MWMSNVSPEIFSARSSSFEPPRWGDSSFSSYTHATARTLPHFKQLIHSFLDGLYGNSSRALPRGSFGEQKEADSEEQIMSRPCAVCANPCDPREVTVGFHLCCGDVIATSLQASKKYGPARRLKAGPNLTKEQRYGVSCIAPPKGAKS